MGKWNIENLMAYREKTAHVLSVLELQRRFHITPIGTLTYYGLVDENIRYFNQTGRALQPKHRSVVDDVLSALYAGYADELTFQLVLEPIQAPDNYAFAASHMELIKEIAKELAQYELEASQRRKRLGIIIRFGSEMNDTDGTAGTTKPDEFISAYRMVRDAFHDLCPQALFPFSPALRADLDVSLISQYWPGIDYVDLAGATWYVHGDNQEELGFTNMAAYFKEFAQYRLPFSLDEFGGAQGSSSNYFDNDLMLIKMFQQIASVRAKGIKFQYATIFLDEVKYGVDATLNFLRNGERASAIPIDQNA
jgi:hypothetical protein